MAVTRTVREVTLQIVRESDEPGYDRVTLLFGAEAVAESACRTTDSDDVAAQRALQSWLSVGNLW